MKKKFTWVKGPGLFISLIFIGLGLLVLTLSFMEYREHARMDIETISHPGGSGSEVSAEQLMSMFATRKSVIDVVEDVSGKYFMSLYQKAREHPPDQKSGHKVRFRVDRSSDIFSREIMLADFDVIVDKNLFSPDREAWKAPLTVDDPQDTPPTATRSRIRPQEVQLHGVINSQGQKMALINHQKLPEQSRSRLVSEGETVYLNRKGDDEKFEIIAIERESITVSAGGDTFQVGLYSHRRQELAASTVMDAEKIKPEQMADDTSRQTQEEALPKFMQRMREGASGEQAGQPGSTQDLERQVEEGTMRRVDTPFGPLYRPIRQ